MAVTGKSENHAAALNLKAGVMAISLAMKENGDRNGENRAAVAGENGVMASQRNNAAWRPMA